MIRDFLQALWDNQGVYGELRVIHVAPEGERPVIEQAFIPVADTGLAELLALNQKPGQNVYFGVLPRLRKAGKAEDTVDSGAVLWADVDAKHFSDVLSEGKSAALAAVNSFPGPTPQMLVDSGGGYHAYWLLTDYHPFPQLSKVMSWIADTIGGDHVQDAARVLRVPGTTNYKPRGETHSRILRMELGDHYRLETFQGLMPSKERRSHKRVTVGEQQDLPEWLVEIIEDGAPKGQRSEACFRAALWMLRYGRTPDQIEQVFESYPQGIGAKYHDKGADGPRWLAYTITAAEEVA